MAGERFHVERAVREVGTAAVERLVFCPVGIHVHDDAGEIVCQVGIFPTGVHDAAVRDHDRRPVTVLIERQAAQAACLGIVRDQVGNYIVAMYAGHAVIADIGRGDHLPVRQVVRVAKFQIRFVDRNLLVKARPVGLYFVYLPFPVRIEGGEQQTVGIPVELYVGDGDIGFRLIDAFALYVTAQVGQDVDLCIVSFA